MGRNNPTSSSNFITFFDSNSAIGRIEGNGAGGIAYRTTGADFAECLAISGPLGTLQAGDVVGVSAGRISHLTEGAEQVLVITDSAALIGNSSGDSTETKRDPLATVAFIGQVRVKVVGSVRCGDLLVPSGREDGTAVALPAEQLQPDQLDRLIGQAWESSDQTECKRINCAISMLAGLGGTGLSRLLTQQQQRLERVEKGLADLLQRLDPL